jgi:DNA-binding LacI/PurR family transcriptional regulator
MRPTLQEIAAAVDLSVSTVSRALNGHPAISQASVARVRQAADELRYRRRKSQVRIDPTQILAGRKVAMVTLGVDRSLLALPVVATAINGVEAALSEAGVDFRLVHVPDPTDVPASLRNLALDGAVLLGPLQGRLLADTHSKLLDRLQGLPAVWLNGRPEGCLGDVVVADEWTIGRAAAEYLVARGHRRLAIVNPKPDHLLFTRREDGFLSHARRLGAEVQCFCDAPSEGWRLPLAPPLHVEAVQRLVDRLLDAQPRPTAVFAVADSVAVLVYRALAVRRVEVAAEVSVISGNNDEALIAALHPHLTTFDIHAEQMGRTAVRHLATRLLGGPHTTDVEVTIPATLIERDSVASGRP